MDTMDATAPATTGPMAELRAALAAKLAADRQRDDARRQAERAALWAGWTTAAMMRPDLTRPVGEYPENDEPPADAAAGHADALLRLYDARFPRLPDPTPDPLAGIDALAAAAGGVCQCDECRVRRATAPAA